MIKPLNPSVQFVLIASLIVIVIVIVLIRLRMITLGQGGALIIASPFPPIP